MRTWHRVMCFFILLLSFSGCSAKYAGPFPEEQGVTGDVPADRTRAVEAVAVALEIGFPEEEIVKLTRDAMEKKIPLSWFARTMEAAANLKGGGMPSDLVVRTARQLIVFRYSEKGIARVEGELFYWRKKQYSWVDAFYQFHSGRRPGMDDGFLH